jgi:hypothetical protein
VARRGEAPEPEVEGAPKGAAGGSRRRVLLERGWVVGIVLFTIGRFVVAYGTLERYGINIWVFGFIDIITAVPYGVSTARLAGAIVDRNFTGMSQWGLLACFTFLAPYLYLIWEGIDAGLPSLVYVVLGALIVIFGTNAAYQVAKQVRQRRLGVA